MNYILFALGAAALVTVVMMASGMRSSLLAQKWPRHAGEVLRSTFKRAMGRLGPQYSVHVDYSYSIGTPRVGACILPSFMGTLREPYARKLAQHFHEGARITVYVDPTNPQRSVLLPGVERREWFLLGMMALVTLGAFVAAFSFR